MSGGCSMATEEMLEVKELDDIQKRKELIEEAKKLQENDNWNEVFRKMNELQKKWKRISYMESALEEELAQEFDSIMDSFYAKRNEGYADIQKKKEELIENAKQLANSTDWNKATNAMNDLMDQWKAAGMSVKEKDDELWNSFREARQVFFDKKHEHWEKMRENHENATEVKKELIEQAKAWVNSEEWQKANQAFTQLFDKWKEAGNAGKNEEELWSQFNEARQSFYARRNEHYDALKKEYSEKLEKKKALVEEAKAVNESQNYSKENTEKMKSLSADWKQIGFCGKENEDAIWNEFRGIMDDYFAGLKESSERRHQEWRNRMQEVRARKQDMINNQKRAIKRMQENMVGMYSQREIDETEESIKDKEDFIKQLEEEIADIDQKLAQ